MKLETLAVGPVACNCCIVACPDTGDAAVIDPGGNADEILATVATMGVTVKLILHTHGHYDHILGTSEVHKVTGARILVHESDRRLYENLPAQGAIFGFRAWHTPAASEWLHGDETIEVGKLRARVLATPGHTPGSVGFYFPATSKDEPPVLLAGDTLFRESVGRTDLPAGSHRDLVASIREKLYVLPDETRVIPGHDGETTIGHEKLHNPFVRP